MRNPWVVIGVLTLILIGGAVWYSNVAAKAANEGVVIMAHIKGNASSTVRLTEYSDFQCPACGQFEPIVAEVVAQYGDKLAFEYKHFPLSQIHPFAESAARAAEAAGQQDKFFEFHDLLFKNQETWVKSGNPSAYFTQYAKDLGLNMDQFTRQMKSSLLSSHVKSQFAEARGKGFTGTPSFELNGKPMKVTSYEDFKAQIAAALGENLVLPTTNSESGTTTGETTPTVQSNVKFGI